MNIVGVVAGHIYFFILQVFPKKYGKELIRPRSSSLTSSRQGSTPSPTHPPAIQSAHRALKASIVGGRAMYWVEIDRWRLSTGAWDLRAKSMHIHVRAGPLRCSYA